MTELTIHTRSGKPVNENQNEETSEETNMYQNMQEDLQRGEEGQDPDREEYYDVQIGSPVQKRKMRSEDESEREEDQYKASANTIMENAKAATAITSIEDT